jgi:hypothetical protein
MKMRNKIFLTISFLTALFILSSCLKDNVGEDWTSSLEGKMYAEVWKAGFAAQALQPVAEPDTFKFLVNIATDALPTQDITVTLAVNEDAMNRYNTAKKASYKLYPNIEILNTSVVIKAGTRNAYAYVKIWGADELNACDNYMAPISIVSATGGVIAADALNQGSRLMALPINNPYAASYKASGSFLHPINGPRVIDEVKTFSTIDCRTVACTPGDLGGDPLLQLTINDDNSVTIGGSLSASQPFIPFTGQTNAYDPATRTFTLNYYYVGSGGNREIHEVDVRQ